MQPQMLLRLRHTGSVFVVAGSSRGRGRAKQAHRCGDILTSAAAGVTSDGQRRPAIGSSTPPAPNTWLKQWCHPSVPGIRRLSELRSFCFLIHPEELLQRGWGWQNRLDRKRQGPGATHGPPVSQRRHRQHGKHFQRGRKISQKDSRAEGRMCRNTARDISWKLFLIWNENLTLVLWHYYLIIKFKGLQNTKTANVFFLFSNSLSIVKLNRLISLLSSDKKKCNWNWLKYISQNISIKYFCIICGLRFVILKLRKQNQNHLLCLVKFFCGFFH